MLRQGLTKNQRPLQDGCPGVFTGTRVNVGAKNRPSLAPMQRTGARNRVASHQR